MKILITGGAGFIGSQIGHHLEENGHYVVLLDNMSYGHEDNLTVDGKKVGEFIHAVFGDMVLTTPPIACFLFSLRQELVPSILEEY